MLDIANVKGWLDENVVPCLKDNDENIPQLLIHSEFHSCPMDEDGRPTEAYNQIVVWLIASEEWSKHVRRLLRENSFYWDYMRELQKVVVNKESRIVFGGDGMPFVGDSGMASVRLFKKVDEVELILEIGQKCKNTAAVKDAISGIFADFEAIEGLNVQAVAKKYTPAFGEA